MIAFLQSDSEIRYREAIRTYQFQIIQVQV